MILEKMSLDGKIALVTGASRGLGRGIALALAEAGANLALVSRSEADLDRMAQEVRALGRKALPLPTDVSTVAGVRDMVARTVDAFGRLDILVNAAGIQIRKPALDMTEEDWDRLLAVNLKSVFFACQAAGRVMIAQGKGKIINIASLTSVQAFPNVSLYAASKGGVAQITKALAVEWGRYGVNVNAIAPGFFKTELTAALFANPDWVEYANRRIPLGRTGVPEDLAGAAVFLASEASDYVHGHVLFVDGGWIVD